MSIVTLPAAVLDSVRVADFDLVRTQSVTHTTNFTRQVTTMSDRHWQTHLEVVYQKGAALLAWSLALDQLSDLANRFALTPPHYEGPSTGYAGADPQVAGADQLGLTLACDGVTPSTAIAGAGDYLSWDVISAYGNTNRQLNKLTSAASSDVGGNVTFSLLLPIRLAPQDGATVEIASPSALFSFVEPISKLRYQLSKLAPFVIEAEEAILP